MRKFTCLAILVPFVLAACGEEGKSEPDDGLIFNVPRLETSNGPSILDDPTADRGGFSGLCAKMQLYCNEQCLTAVGEQAGNCTLLQLNIGTAESIAVDAVNLYYTAAASEILKMDLATGEHSSLVTGLRNPGALYPTSGVLYFGNNPPSSDNASDVRVLFVGRPDVTVLTEHLGTVFDLFLSADTLLVGAGAFDKGPLYSAPKNGGRWSAFSAPEILHFEVSGETVVFSMSTASESGIFATTIASPNSYTQVCGGDPTGDPISDFFVEGDFAYWFASKAINTARAYTRVSLSGGQKQEIQNAGSGILLAHNAGYTFYADTEPGMPGNIIMIPIGGGEATLLGTYESNELQAAAADDAHLYVALGYARDGGIVRFDL